MEILNTQLQEQFAEMHVLTTQLASAKRSGTEAPFERKKPYTVQTWRHKYKGEKVKVNDIIWHFCRKDHWSDCKPHNVMYCCHTTKEYDEWRRKFDAKKEALKESGPDIEVIEGPNKRDRDTSTPALKPAPDDDAKKKRLALSDSIQSALTTQMGMTAGHWKSVWEEACEESRNY